MHVDIRGSDDVFRPDWQVEGSLLGDGLVSKGTVSSVRETKSFFSQLGRGMKHLIGDEAHIGGRDSESRNYPEEV